ncbi:MAG: translation initiation factor IF-3 [Desulfomonile tiedjei]|uniref:Translation initiation factor IF-3 n=1 Tax=Desulfomonile tiedjei TaxID=2358 RepID=A0A9D6V5Z3_9BACT|nr:translation initiation factor IF-3 [Desulfomonile tiedjei]
MKGRPRGPVVAEPKVRVNQRIRAPKIRVISPDGEQLGILDVSDALRRAEEFGLDLVEVAPGVDPPVCKIMDYGKFRYEESKKEHERKKKQATVILKEIKLRPKTEEHDLDYKVKRLKRFISEDCKVKVTIMFRGREITHPEQARMLMDKLLELVGNDAQIEQPAKFEGRNMTMVLAPK